MTIERKYTDLNYFYYSYIIHLPFKIKITVFFCIYRYISKFIFLQKVLLSAPVSFTMNTSKNVRNKKHASEDFSKISACFQLTIFRKRSCTKSVPLVKNNSKLSFPECSSLASFVDTGKLNTDETRERMQGGHYRGIFALTLSFWPEINGPKHKNLEYIPIQ